MKYEKKFHGELVDCIDVDANSEAGFNFPFTLILPKNISEHPDLIYVCNLPHFYTNMYDSMDDLIRETKKDTGTIDPVHEYLSFTRGNPMLIPFIPRFKDFRPNFLGRDCFLNEFKISKWDNKNFERYFPMYYNLADQHKAMFEYAVKTLYDESIYVDDRAVICGYSEGAKFASHLALLHPEMIKAVIAGGTGGAISMPVSEVNGYKFIYPTGTADFPDFNFDEYKNIAFFYYMADNDKSDSAMPNFEDYYYTGDDGEKHVLVDECGNKTPYIDEEGKQHFILDENGNYTAKWSLFSDEEVNAINKVLGTVTQDRFWKQEEIYHDLELMATFKMYPGNHKTVFDNMDLIEKHLDEFINSLNNDYKNENKQ